MVDWLVVVVESAEARSKANKLLPRSSVIDKVKADINSKHGDRSVTARGAGIRLRMSPVIHFDQLVNSFRFNITQVRSIYATYVHAERITVYLSRCLVPYVTRCGFSLLCV